MAHDLDDDESWMNNLKGLLWGMTFFSATQLFLAFDCPITIPYFLLQTTGSMLYEWQNGTFTFFPYSSLFEHLFETWHSLATFASTWVTKVGNDNIICSQGICFCNRFAWRCFLNELSIVFKCENLFLNEVKVMIWPSMAKLWFKMSFYIRFL